MFVVGAQGAVCGVDGPVVADGGDGARADSEHGFDGEERADGDGAVGFGPVFAGARDGVGDVGGCVEGLAVAVAAEAPDAVQAVVGFDGALDRACEVDVGVARLEGLDAFVDRLPGLRA